MSDLPAGEYTLQVTGAGFAPVWYPSAAAQPDAQPVELTTGQTVSGLTIVVGGVPATLGGTVSGARRRGRPAHGRDAARRPAAGRAWCGPETGEAAPTGGLGGRRADRARSAPTARSRSTELPSPAVYDLVVAKAGFASTVQRVDVAAGRGPHRDPAVACSTGDGSISGHGERRGRTRRRGDRRRERRAGGRRDRDASPRPRSARSRCAGCRPPAPTRSSSPPRGSPPRPSTSPSRPRRSSPGVSVLLGPGPGRASAGRSACRAATRAASS